MLLISRCEVAEDHFAVTPVDQTTAPVIERCSVSTAGLVDAAGDSLRFDTTDAGTIVSLRLTTT